MDAQLVLPHTLVEWDTETEPRGDERLEEGGEPDLCCYYITEEAFVILDKDQVMANNVSEELHDTVTVFRSLLDFRENTVLRLAAWSAVMVHCVLGHAHLPLRQREAFIRSCATRNTALRRYSTVDEGTLCGFYFHEIARDTSRCEADNGVDSDGDPVGSGFEPWLKHHCFDVFDSEYDPSRVVLSWDKLNLHQTAVLCAWNNMWTMYLLASAIGDDELLPWFDRAVDVLSSRARDVLKNGWSNDLLVSSSREVLCKE
ncbi:hypothetical protein VFPBJ_11765 [Purpureocillium lilacinum]|uniref:Uncharacterized protein n=1 Tax=Purpureocillium lilacinum TaxID=33203 RepID=A0A179EVU0_PURLI|nr:hypothetical protein VFPBJ_11765 [Purpureocillium lilacinum]